MNIRFNCADCGKEYKVPAKFAGKKVKCKKCGAKIRVPDGDEAESTPKTSSKKVKSPSSSAKTEKKAASAKVSKKTKKTSAKVLKKSSGGTEVIEIPDIEAEKKLYEAKKKEEKKMNRGTGRLVYFKDGKAVKSYRLDGETRIIGRGAGCEVSIDDASLSDQHIKIEVRLGKFIATDLKSSNGLVVNHKKVRRSALVNGDIIQLGRAVLRIDCG